jgi:Na+/H+ antiporter NhaB
MGSISIPAIGAFVSTYGAAIGAAASAVSAGVGAYESYKQGEAASNAAKQKARVEADNATQQQITQRQNMLRALASQNAAGMGAGTNVTASTMRQINQGQNDLLVSQANSSAQVSLLDQQASNAMSAGIAGAVGGGISALGLGVKAFGSLPSGSPSSSGVPMEVQPAGSLMGLN